MQSAMLHNSLILLDPVPLQWASTAMPQLPIHCKHCRQAVLTHCQVSSGAVQHDMTLCAKYRMELHPDNQRKLLTWAKQALSAEQLQDHLR